MDSQRLILAMVFAFSLLMLWQAWHKEAPAPQVPGTTAAGGAGMGTPVPDVPRMAQKKDDSGGVPGAVVAPVSDAPRIGVRTDLMDVQISTLGGDLARVELLLHRSSEDASRNLVLLDLGGAHRYGAQSGLIGDGLPNHKSLFKASADKVELKDGESAVSVTLETETGNGVKLERTYRFQRGSYAIDVTDTVVNGSAGEVSPYLYRQLVRDGGAPEGSVPMMTTFTGPAVYTDEEKFQKIEFSDLDKDKAKFSRRAKDGWLGMVQHYFVSAWVPEPGVEREFFARRLAEGYYAAGVIVPTKVLASGDKISSRATLYVGPQEQDKLVAIAPGLDLVVDYGWLHVIAAPLFWILQMIYKVVGNWGWAIVLLTVLVKAVFFPLSAASYKSMARMRLITPRLQLLKERYGDDRQRLNQEMMELYKKEKINPFGGCLPILIQIPVFIALYWVLLGSVEMRNAPWILWIKDLSVMDPYYVLPLIMGASMFVQTKLNPTPPDPIQAKVMLFMPVIFTGMFLFFPAGLVLYWIVNNVLSIAQQWQITRMIEGGKAPERG